MLNLDEIDRNIKAMAPSGYGKFLGKGERHGSYEWTWSRDDRELKRFVTMALTPEYEQQSPRCRAEVFMGADDGEHFARYLVERFDCGGLSDIIEEPLKTKLATALNIGADRANILVPGNLTNVRVTTVTVKEAEKIKEVGEELKRRQ